MKSETKRRAAASVRGVRSFKYHFRYNMVFISRKPKRARAAPKNMVNWAMSKPPVIGTTNLSDHFAPNNFQMSIEGRVMLPDDVAHMVQRHDDMYFERKYFKMLTRSFIGHIIGEYGYAIQD